MVVVVVEERKERHNDRGKARQVVCWAHRRGSKAAKASSSALAPNDGHCISRLLGPGTALTAPTSRIELGYLESPLDPHRCPPNDEEERAEISCTAGLSPMPRNPVPSLMMMNEKARDVFRPSP